MGQGEFLKFIEKNPRLTTREIAIALGYTMDKASRFVQKMVRHGDLIATNPSEEEVKNLVSRFPKIVHGLWNVKVFVVRKDNE